MSEHSEKTLRIMTSLESVILETNRLGHKTDKAVGLLTLKQEQTHIEVLQVKKELHLTKVEIEKVNGRVGNLELDSKTRIAKHQGKKQMSASIKKNITWVLGIVTGVGGLIFAAFKWL